MNYYPVNLKIANKKCAVIGGGRVAERKTKALLEAGGRVFVFSPTLTEELSAFTAQGIISFSNRPYQKGDIEEDFFLVICASDDAETNARAALEARQKGVLVDAADNAELSDFIAPAVVKRGGLVITVSTSGQSPRLASVIKKEIASFYGEEYGTYLDLVARAREELKEKLAAPKDRENFWRKVLTRDVLELVRQGKTEEAQRRLSDLED